MDTEVQARRKTKQRQVILEELQKLHSHPTASDLYRVVRQRFPRVSLGTVYRNLELLNESGTIRKLQIGGREARFDAVDADHHHVQCTSCGRVDDLPVKTDVPTDLPENTPEGWQIEECRVEFVGLCPDCNASGSGHQ